MLDLESWRQFSKFIMYNKNPIYRRQFPKQPDDNLRNNLTTIYEIHHLDIPLFNLGKWMTISRWEPRFPDEQGKGFTKHKFSL
jgi:hypothetical protein